MLYPAPSDASTSPMARRPVRIWTGAALVIGLLLMVMIETRSSAGDDGPVPAHRAPAHTVAAASDVSATAPPSPAASLAQASTPPAGLSVEQWQSLRERLADHPQRDAEIARIVAFFQYRQAVDQLRVLRTRPDDRAAFLAAAHAVDDGLAQRLANGEVNAGEAYQLKAVALEALEPDPQRRLAELRRWHAEMKSRMSAAPAPTESPEAIFREREAMLLAEQRVLAPAQRDEAKLAAQLQALREQVFDAASNPAAASTPKTGGTP